MGQRGPPRWANSGLSDIFLGQMDKGVEAVGGVQFARMQKAGECSDRGRTAGDLRAGRRVLVKA